MLNRKESQLLIIVIAAGSEWKHLQNLLSVDFHGVEVQQAGGFHPAARIIDTRPIEEKVVLLYASQRVQHTVSTTPDVEYVSYNVDETNNSLVCCYADCWRKPLAKMKEFFKD